MTTVATDDDSLDHPSASSERDEPEGDAWSNVSAAVAPLLHSVFGKDLPLRFEFFDGGGFGPSDGPGTVLVRSADAIRRLLFAPGELGIARAYVAGDLDIEGDLFESLHLLRR